MPTEIPAPSADQSPKLPDHVRRRKVAMLNAGVTGLEIANRLGIKKQSVSKVITGAARTPRIRKAIADACNLPLEELFPDASDTDVPNQVTAA